MARKQITKNVNPLAGYLSVPDAAARLSIRTATLYRYFHRGIVKKTAFGRAVFVAESEIERFSRERKPSGNPNFRRP